MAVVSAGEVAVVSAGEVAVANADRAGDMGLSWTADTIILGGRSKNISLVLVKYQVRTVSAAAIPGNEKRM